MPNYNANIDCLMLGYSMSDSYPDPSVPPTESSQPSGPNRIMMVTLASVVAICLCGGCLFFVGPALGKALALATVCSVRSIDDQALQKCTNWAVDIVLNHADAYDQCETTRDTVDPGTSDDAVMLCLEDKGLGPRP